MSLDIFKWVGSDMWLRTDSGQEIEIKYGDLILLDGDIITTGFMSEKLPRTSINIVHNNTRFYQSISDASMYQDIYYEDLTNRNPNAPIIATLDETAPRLSTGKARDVAKRFGVTFSK